MRLRKQRKKKMSDNSRNNSDVVMESAREILNAVNSAVQTQQYQNLSSQIMNTVNSAKSQIQANARQAQNQRQAQNVQQTRAETQQTAPYQNRQYQAQTPNYQRTRSTDRSSGGLQFTNVPNQRFKATPFITRQISRSKGLGSLIGGIFGGFFMAILALGFLIWWLVGDLAVWQFILFALFAGLTGLFGWMIGHGVRLQKLVSRFYEYGKIAGDSEYITVDQISRMTGVKKERVVADLKEMKRQDLLPFATFDEGETTLMLTEKAYNEYLAIERQRKAIEEERAIEAKTRDAIEQSDLPTDVKALLSEGRAYLLKVRNYNDEIPDTEEMSDKLYELENIMKRIFSQVEKEPGRAKELRKFMTYYLPTTDKLLSSYVDMCKQGADGENVRRAKREIEDTMNVINDAFSHLLDQMFEDISWDVSADISVMKSMMAQDGLTRPELEREKVHA